MFSCCIQVLLWGSRLPSFWLWCVHVHQNVRATWPSWRSSPVNLFNTSSLRLWFLTWFLTTEGGDDDWILVLGWTPPLNLGLATKNIQRFIWYNWWKTDTLNKLLGTDHAHIPFKTDSDKISSLLWHKVLTLILFRLLWNFSRLSIRDSNKQPGGRSLRKNTE